TVVWLTVVFGPEIGSWWERTSSTFTSPEAFRAWVEGFGAWGPVVFLIAQAIQVMLAPIPGTLFSPVGSLAFGPWQAMGLSLAGLAIGSAVIFLAARRWGRPLAVRLLGEDLIHRYQNVMTARGGLLLWVVFLLPLLPDDAVCALAGLSGISFRRFMVIATVGRVPAVAAGVFAMAGLEGAPAWVWLFVGSVFVLVMWLGARYGRRLEGWLLGAIRRDGQSLSSTAVDEALSPRQAVAVQTSATMVDKPDRLIPVLMVVVVTTLIAAIAGVMAGVSGLATGIILVWGVTLAVMVAWARED
ncbi:MAG: TVP38/TMEM64 family protein, partial [Acidimicrobiia bacterium]